MESGIRCAWRRGGIVIGTINKSKEARYLVGIDLGTTHTVVAYTDTQAGDFATGNAAGIHLFEIEQLVAPGEVAARPMLPSMRYHPAPNELAESDIQLPWSPVDLGLDVPQAVIGELARELGSHVPGRLVSSAKSWLSHPSVDRTAAILPWGGAEDIKKISPLLASTSYLAHVRSAWNWRFPDYPLEQQEVVLTVPASFDEAARILTVDAANKAGLTPLLVEEPQAACYDWLARHNNQLESELADTRLLLVCDVGGGTTDFTLVKIELEKQGPKLTRIAVGNHLMLGGDNMDLAIAHVAEARIVASGTKLGAANLSQLVQQCRSAKERLLAPEAPERTSVTVLGAGARLIGAARSTELSRQEIKDMVLEGFFPWVGLDERPQRLRGGIVEFGLPYVADPAMTRHVAAFLSAHTQACQEALGNRAPNENPPIPDTVLLNGGVFRSGLLAERLLDMLAEWRTAPLKQLHNDAPDLAVARGAVAYAIARRGRGVKIGGGSARSYFLQVEGEQAQQSQGVCLLPRGTEEGQEIVLKDRTFSLRLGQPVRFYLVSSVSDIPFQPGDLVDIDEENFIFLPPIASVLGQNISAREIAVQLTTLLTEVGTLAMSCVAREKPSQRWKLEFQLRGGAQTGVAAVTGELHPRFAEAVERVERIYGTRAKDINPKEVKNLRNDLEKILGKRDEWDTPLLRELFAVLWDDMGRRRRSSIHERLWFNLTGFCLRPGFGYPLDDWRVEQLWSIYEQGVQFVPEAAVWAEWWTLWRRVAGGLEQYAQERLFDDLAYDLQPPALKPKKRPVGVKKQGYDDMVRLVAALERLPVERKIEVGSWLLIRLRKSSESTQTWWAVGRIGSRVPFYGSAHNVVPREIAEDWLAQALAVDWKNVQPAAFAATLLARMSGDRTRDLEQELCDKIIQRLRGIKAPASWIKLVQEVAQLDRADEQRIFGDSLPPGLRLIH